MVDTARLGAQMAQQYFTCTVLDIPAGDPPKLITVRLPTIDSPANVARWRGFPAISVGSSVVCRRDPNDQDVLVVEGSGDEAMTDGADESGLNPVINGGFNFWQLGTSFTSVATGTRLADMWLYSKSGTMVHDVSQSADVPAVVDPTTPFSLYSMLVDCTTADTSINSSDFTILYHRMEGYNFHKIAQRQFTLSFWVKATKTGTYCVAFSNLAGFTDRSYVAEYTVDSADTWEYKTITVSASPSAGSWNYTNGTGLQITWALAAGSNWHATADAWQTGNYFVTSNQVNACDSATNNFRIAMVDIVPGANARTFVPVDYQLELERAQRYLEVLTPGATTVALSSGQCVSTTAAATALRYKTKRTLPSLSLSAAGHFDAIQFTGALAGGATGHSFSSIGLSSAALTLTGLSGLVAGDATIMYFINSSAYIRVSAGL